ncbi:MAG: glycosyltransferase [Treponema sp.]|nr:glycosyltransferase [Treponema sp.]MBQ6566219.1 glycosyltransferase [Treponema sp.]
MQTGGLRTKGITKSSRPGEPLISVVTVVHDGAETLEQTIRSVLGQTYGNVEYVIIDGGSTDGTLDIIRKYEDKIDFWQSEPDGGIYDAMNKGVSLATGEYIALLNADDWYEPGTCALVAGETGRSRADVYHGLLRFLDRDGNVLKIEGWTTALIADGMIAHPTCFVSREVYMKNKYDVSFRSAADYDFINRLVREGASFCFLPEIMANFRTGGSSAGKTNVMETNRIRRRYGYISPLGYFLRSILYKLTK